MRVKLAADPLNSVAGQDGNGPQPPTSEVGPLTLAGGGGIIGSGLTAATGLSARATLSAPADTSWLARRAFGLPKSFLDDATQARFHSATRIPRRVAGGVAVGGGLMLAASLAAFLLGRRRDAAAFANKQDAFAASLANATPRPAETAPASAPPAVKLSPRLPGAGQNAAVKPPATGHIGLRATVSDRAKTAIKNWWQRMNARYGGRTGGQGQGTLG